MSEVDVLADSIMVGLKGYVASRLGPIVKELEDCKAAIAARPKAGEVAAGIKTMVADAVATIPVPKDGKDAEQVDVDALRALLVDEIIKAVGELPQAKNGEPGVKGEPGKDGLPGKDGASITVADVEPIIFEAVVKSVDALPLAERGLPGERGEPGLPGKDGTSITLADVEPMLTAAVSKAMAEATELIAKQLTAIIPASFLVDDGGDLLAIYSSGNKEKVGHVRGKDGKHGASIMDGAVNDGQLILRMSDGRVINAGTVKGESGDPGVSVKGEPGRDALELSILTAIDENTSYPARTVAAYGGGTIRAARDTDPIVDGDVVKAGWIVLMNGIADQDDQFLDDGRIHEKRTRYTSGKTLVTRHETSNMIYRGLWKEGEYQKGDVVTWGGSAFHCERPTTDKPEVNDSWRIVAKRGRDGHREASKH